MSARLLLERTGEVITTWNQRIATQGFSDERELRAWLAEQGVTGYAQSLLVMERYGDAHPLNILFHGDCVSYIDWEWVAIGDPAHDIAMLGWDVATAWQMELTGERRGAFLDTYLALEPDDTLRERRALWMITTMFFDQLYHRTQISSDTSGKQAYTVQQIQTYLGSTSCACIASGRGVLPTVSAPRGSWRSSVCGRRDACARTSISRVAGGTR